MLQDEELSYTIRGCVFEVYRTLGAGFLESVYQEALLYELGAAGVKAVAEVPLSVSYKGQDVGFFRADIVVEDRVILELKAQKTLPPYAEAQLLNYLKASRLKLGMLVNFTEPKASVKRLVL